MNCDEAIEYIHSFSWKGSRPGLSRIKELCRRLGSPEKGLSFIHVAGTNGKGSVSAELANILTHAGYKTGLFTSPFVLNFRERIRIGDEMIGEEALARIMTEIRTHADLMEDKPTEFELITAAAFEYFRLSECDLVVLETGLGGRLDSTNIIDSPLLSIITGIALDHTAVLGSSVEAIATEKSGIIKPGSPVLFGSVPPCAARIIQDRAKECSSRCVETDFSRITNRSLSLDKSSFTFKSADGDHDASGDYSLSLLGKYQIDNAATVLTAVEELRRAGVSIDDKAVYDGLASTVWHARFEVLSRDPLVIYDGAHNPNGLSAAAESLEALMPGVRPVFLIGVMEDKEHLEMARILSGVASYAHTVKPDNPRAMNPENLSDELAVYGVPSVSHVGLKDGVASALSQAREEHLPLVILGSLYMYADVLSALRELGVCA